MELFGLLGKRLGHSFSREYFNSKFKENGRNASYVNFEINDIACFPIVIRQFGALKGLNVTVPYKEQVLPYLDEISADAESIGAVNMIRINHDDPRYPYTIGHNTDYIGFRDSLHDFILDGNGSGRDIASVVKRTLILGSGGASKAVKYALESLGVEVTIVSRKPHNLSEISYEDLSKDIVESSQLIVNTTPLGMWPNVNSAPQFPYHYLSDKHYCYDVVYNPLRTEFMRLCANRGAKVKNGLEMLHRQAEAANF
jgi:shikimate dehydrogenase